MLPLQMHALSKDPEGEQVLNSTAAAMTTQTATTREDEANDSDQTVEQLQLKIKRLESEILLLKVDILYYIGKTKSITL